MACATRRPSATPSSSPTGCTPSRPKRCSRSRPSITSTRPTTTRSRPTSRCHHLAPGIELCGWPGGWTFQCRPQQLLRRLLLVLSGRKRSLRHVVNDGSHPNATPAAATPAPRSSSFISLTTCAWAATSPCSAASASPSITRGFNESAIYPRIGATVEIPRLHWVLRGFYGHFFQPAPLETVSSSVLNYASQPAHRREHLHASALRARRRAPVWHSNSVQGLVSRHGYCQKPREQLPRSLQPRFPVIFEKLNEPEILPPSSRNFGHLFV